TMMWLANPRRRKWWFALPGGTLTMLLWLLGSLGLQLYLAWLLRAGSVYGAIAAPIAVMLWILVTTLAIFVGVTLNAAILLYRDVSRQDHSALRHREESALVASGKAVRIAEMPVLTEPAIKNPPENGSDGGASPTKDPEPGDPGGDAPQPDDPAGSNAR
ncbi:MAG: YihY/virulence factor BrkB family protein, partial [Actinomycetia bacterium]|nr:YihY/virulence factor BrkB family protein [Actinomycetes bacterium]